MHFKLLLLIGKTMKMNVPMYGLVELLNNFIGFDSVDRKTPKINF
jgi:hypothetical protein